MQGQVLDDKIQAVVGVFDPRNGDITNLFDDLWEDDFTNIVPQFRFELETALVVE